MKMVVSIFLILSFPTLVFADMLYFKDDTSLEGEIIDYKGNYIIFKVDNINDIHFGNRKYIIKEIDIQTIMFDMNYVDMATDSKGEIIAMRISQDESIIGTNEAQYQYKAKADAKEDFNSGIKWSEISILALRIVSPSIRIAPCFIRRMASEVLATRPESFKILGRVVLFLL